VKDGDSVRAKGLVKRFGNFVAVDHVSFEVRRGEIFGFLGSNGAGKSTTIRMLCGLLEPTEGEAEVGGFDVRTDSEQIKQNIGYMSQKFSLYNELSVEENLDFFAGVYSVARNGRKRRKEEILKRMDLRERRGTVTGLLPGGWKQRLALGCAILHEPSILFLDEPTSGVDPIARRAFWDLIGELSDEGRTVFVTTHYMDEAEYCHRLALMHAGRIIALDSPLALRKSMRRDHFYQLRTNNLIETLRALEGKKEIDDVSIYGSGLRLRTRWEGDFERLVREALDSSGIKVLDFSPVEPGMEDVFVSRIEETEGGE